MTSDVRPRHPAVLAALLALTAMAPLADIALPARAQSGDSERDAAYAEPYYPPQPCTVKTTARAVPEVVLLGETVRLERTVRVDCEREPLDPLDVVLVIDATSSMAGERLEALQQALSAYWRPLDRFLAERGRAAVVVLGDEARVVCPMGSSRARLAACTRDLKPGGSATLAEGLLLAGRILKTARDDWPDPYARNRRREVIVVFSAAAPAVDCPQAHRVAHRVSGQGTLVAALCIEPDCDRRCLRGVVTNPRWVDSGSAAARLGDMTNSVRQTLGGRLYGIGVSELLLDGAPAVPESARGATSEHFDVDAAITQTDEGERVHWSGVFRDALTYTLTVDVRPKQPGRQPLSDGAELTYQARFWTGIQRSALPSPTVVVLDPR